MILTALEWFGVVVIVAMSLASVLLCGFLLVLTACDIWRDYRDGRLLR